MAELGVVQEAIQNTRSQAGKFLTFMLGKEEYGISILKVKEIIGIMAITEVPNNPEFAKGVINLRDRVIPIIDLRLKFNMEEKEYDSRTCIIVVEVLSRQKKIQIGIVVDEVSEVLSVAEREIEPPPDFGTQTEQANILGMAKVAGKLKILLDIDRVLSHEEIATIGGAA